MEEYKVLLDKRKKYKPSLPCPKDGTSLLHHCIKNGVWFVEGPQGQPEAIWNADLYLCPTCRNRILTDFGDRPQWTTQNTPDLPAFIVSEVAYNKRAMLVYSYQFERRAAA